MIVQVVKYKTGLSDEEAAKTIAQRAPQYKALPGLRQKLYIREPETGEYGGIYVWEDEDSMRDFRESDLAGTIPPPTESRASRESRCSRSSLSFAPNEVSHRRVEPVGGGGYLRSPAASRASSRVRNASMRMIRPFLNVHTCAQSRSSAAPLPRPRACSWRTNDHALSRVNQLPWHQASSPRTSPSSAA